MSLAVNISDACRRHIATSYAAASEVADGGVDEDRTPSGRRRPCRTEDDFRARVAAFSSAYWDRVDSAVLPATLAHRRYVERVGSAASSVVQGAEDAAAWLDFPRALFNVSRRRLPWTRRRRRRRRQRPRRPSDDDYDDELVDFWMFLDVPDVDDAATWKTRLRHRCA